MRNRIQPVIYGFLLALMLAPRLVAADAAYQAVTQGNMLYQQEQYREAAQQYAKAAEQRPEAAEIYFNLGNAAYKQQDYAKAHEHYSRALQTTNPVLESQTKYNLGNINYQQALQALTNPPQAVEHLQAAMTYYRDCLDVVPQQPEARYNLELAHRLLQQLQQQSQQQDQPQHTPQQEQNNQQDRADSSLQQAQQDRQEQDQNQQSQQGPQAQQQNPQDQQQRTPSQGRQDQPTAQSDEDATNDPGTPLSTVSQDLSPEEAERLLSAIRERAREADNLRQQRQRVRLRDNRVDKDW